MMEEGVARFALYLREAEHIRAMKAQKKTAALANDGNGRTPIAAALPKARSFATALPG
jgi:hypothetical protein